MSTQGRKPAESTPLKVKNVNLLPTVFNTEPNRKMLASTLDVMTSKGQLLPFKETYGTRNSADRLEEFLVKETDPVRRESQANSAFVIENQDQEYQGKVSYYDIENYFNVKGLPLHDGVVLDKNVNILDLPIDYSKFSDYNLYYWLEDDLPPCQIHQTTEKFTIADDLLGRPFAVVKDDTTGRSLELQNGMIVYFTGEVDEEYKTYKEVSASEIVVGKEYTITNIGNTNWNTVAGNTAEDQEYDISGLSLVAKSSGSGTGRAIDMEIKLYYVYGVGTSIQLIRTTDIEFRSPLTGFGKRAWDRYQEGLDYVESSWDGEVWDGSRITVGDPEYVTQEKYSTNANHWQAVDHWYHISIIRSVVKFLGIDVEDLVSAGDKARRPIICFDRRVKLYNWPTGTSAEVASYLSGTASDYIGKNNIKDRFGYTLEDGDLVVFSNSSGIYQADNLASSATFSLDSNSSEGAGAIITANSSARYYQLIYKDSQWQFAQNKLEKNQTPRFDFYLSDGTSVESLNDVNFNGGIILGFKEGTTYDSVLEKNIEISNIEFDVVSDQSLGTVNPNQIKFITEVDSEFQYFDADTSEEFTTQGPYGYSVNSQGTEVEPFYRPRTGIDFTRQMQDLTYEVFEDSAWAAEYIPTTEGFTSIHVYHDDVDGYKFYYELDGYGLVRFTSKTSNTLGEQILPLVSGGVFSIVCHDLPQALTLYRVDTEDNITKPAAISSDYIVNNSITNGVIELDLSELVEVDGTYVINDLATDNTRLYWSAGNDDYRIAYVRPLDKWSFVQFAYLKDPTDPLYYDYDYTASDVTLDDGSLSFYRQITVTDQLLTKIQTGDKICLSSVIKNPKDRTAPLALTANPLNEALSTVSYYGLYQHAITLKANSTNIKQFLDPTTTSPSYLVGGGTLVKHNDPLAKFAVAATNLPYDPSELVIKQGKHYDSFLGKLKTELEFVVNNNDTSTLDSLAVLNLALTRIYSSVTSDDLFWSHSNMIGWGDQINNYVEQQWTVTDSGVFDLTDVDLEFSAVSHSAGQESIVHVMHGGQLLKRGQDYDLTGTDSYTAIEFYNLAGESVTIRQWLPEFRSLVPASLAKLGLTGVYEPGVYHDTTNNSYYLVRHDGTRYYLEDGVDTNNYPENLVEQYLYEYELAVWSSISRDVEQHSQRSVVEGMPGYFRTQAKTYQQVRQIVDNETRQWMLENNIFIMSNTDYDDTNGFTLKYQLGTGDGEYFVGSWRSFYRYFYDTDRPHTHPWEMLGYSLKPQWWDTHYGWTDSAKRLTLKRALRTGKISNPDDATVINPAFARCLDIAQVDLDALEDFPVDVSGNLLSPLDFNAVLIAAGIEIGLDYFDSDTNWEAGDIGPYEQVFLNTHRGLAAEIRARYLGNPTVFVNQNWLPGQSYVNEWGNKLDKTTGFWQQPALAHTTHRSQVDGVTVYTSGLESLLVEFCILDNKDYTTEVIEKFNYLSVNKEFLLKAFTNKDNVRIKSNSVSSSRNILFVPDENYSVRTVKHYPSRESFYSAVRIIFDGTNYSVNGFANEYGYFAYYQPVIGSPTRNLEVGNITVKEKTRYSGDVELIAYGQLFSSRQDVYDFLIGYGRYLEDQGFVYEEVEAGDIRNWQLSAKQFVFWSSDSLAAGNYIDLNPSADFIKLTTAQAQLDNLEGTNENVGQCVDRLGKPLFSKDLLVSRDDDYTVIKTKNSARSIYGIKMAFSVYESVVHVEPTSVFGDVYFSTSENASRRSFLVGGKKSQGWTGNYSIPGYVFSGSDLLPNLDSMAEAGRNLLDVENAVVDPAIVEASRSQFGLTRNPELRELFLQEDNEVLFKNAITYNKGTKQVFDSLNPLTHQDGSSTSAYEEYMVRIGEIGNVKNHEYYEFELGTEDIVQDVQIVKFVDEAGTDPKTVYIEHSDKTWIYRPYNKQLSFDLLDKTNSRLSRSGPIIKGDTDLYVNELDDVLDLFDQFVDLWSVPNFDAASSYKVDDRVRYRGRIYLASANITADQWEYESNTTLGNKNYFVETTEPYLPNIYVANYPKPNTNLGNEENSTFTPGTWQVLQTTDRFLGIGDACPGPNDTSKARITTLGAHLLAEGDYVLIVGADTKTSSVNGLWKVDSLVEGSDSQFYINTRIIDSIGTGKVFTFKPVRFKNSVELELALADSSYSWIEKYQGEYSLTPSGYDSRYPIAIVDNSATANNISNDYGDYTVYSIVDGQKITVKTEVTGVDLSNIEHLIVYDYEQNKTMVKLELFSPENLYIPRVFKDDIDTIGRVDPAKYNRTTDPYKSIYTSLGWYEEYVGRRWWNTSSLQFGDYVTASAEVKAKYWGSTVTDTLPEIYEWTKSTVHPSQWFKLVERRSTVFGQLATGEAYVDRSLGEDQYHWVEEQDYVNGSAYTVYYFWVKNKQTIAEESKAVRVYTVAQLSQLVLNPSAAGLAWWCPVATDTIIIKGIKPYLNNTSTVVQIKKKTQGNSKHQQWLFVSEGNTVETIPEWLHVRFRDSIAGRIQYQRRANYTNFNTSTNYKQGDIVKHAEKFFICKTATVGSFDDEQWQLLTNVNEVSKTVMTFETVKNVPDLRNLHRYNRLGNSIRPYAQTWFKNLFEARRTLILKLNEILLNVNVTGLTNWGSTELNSTALLVGDELLDMTEFWNYADFVNEEYDSTKSIAVLTEDDNLYSQQTLTGDYVRVNTSATEYTIYRKNADGSFTIMFKKNAAIQFKDLLYLDELYTAWDMAAWDSPKYPWDFDRNAAFKTIIDSLREEIFVGSYMKYYSAMICSMFRYVLSEQVNVDWLAKSSTVEPVNLIAQTLTNSDTVKRDEILALTDFYASVKSYRDKIRGGTINKVTLEDMTVSIIESYDVDNDITDPEFLIGSGSEVELPIDITGQETLFDPLFVIGSEGVDLPINVEGN